MGEVIDIFSRRKNTKSTQEVVKPAVNLDEVEDRNREAKQRLEKERMRANKNVKQSYRIN